MTYTPTAGYFGTDFFTYTATGAGGTSNVARVDITVATPAAPVTTDKSGVAIPYNGTGTGIEGAANLLAGASAAGKAGPAGGKAKTYVFGVSGIGKRGLPGKRLEPWRAGITIRYPLMTYSTSGVGLGSASYSSRLNRRASTSSITGMPSRTG